MLDPARPADIRGSRAVPVATLALALAVFIVDTATPFEINIGLFYLPVVLLAARFLQGRQLVLVAAACAVLSIASFVINVIVLRNPPSLGGTVNMLGLVPLAIALTTWFLLQAQDRQRKLREQAGLLDLTQAAMFSRDADDRIEFWNRGAEELYGWHRTDAVGRVAHELLETIFPVPLAEIEAELRRTGRWAGELVHTRRDGEKRFVDSRWSLQRDEQGQPVLILETNTDTTERKRTGEALRQAEADLARMHRVLVLGELSSSIAHEINQPVSALITNASAGLRWLAARPPNVDEARLSLEAIAANGHRVSEIIARICGLAKKAPPRRESVDVNDVIREVVALSQPKLTRHRVHLVSRLADNMPRVMADSLQLQQVVLNLLVNAVEAMDGVADRPRELTITSAAGEKDQALVEVRDTGVGLDPTNADRLFQSFYTTKADGMGMGLAISRSIIAAHEGRLSAAPNEPHGALFRLTLPIDGSESRPGARLAGPDAP